MERSQQKIVGDKENINMKTNKFVVRTESNETLYECPECKLSFVGFTVICDSRWKQIPKYCIYCGAEMEMDDAFANHRAWLEQAKSAYKAYGASTNFKNYQGLPMPEWDALPEAIQIAWGCVVKAVITEDRTIHEKN